MAACSSVTRAGAPDIGSRPSDVLGKAITSLDRFQVSRWARGWWVGGQVEGGQVEGQQVGNGVVDRWKQAQIIVTSLSLSTSAEIEPYCCTARHGTGATEGRFDQHTWETGRGDRETTL